MIVWSYTIYGSNFDAYYKPMLYNLNIAKSRNVQVIISTTDIYVEQIKTYFSLYLTDFKLIIYPSNIYNGSEKILRYLSMKTVDADYYFIKDSDSIVTEREIYVMNHWMNLTNEDYIIIRDNPIHVAPVLAGMFGFRKNVCSFIVNNCNSFFTSLLKKGDYGYDQRWLAEKIYPTIKNRTIVYSSFFYFKGENLIIINRVNNLLSFIGSQSNENSNSRSLENQFYSFYNSELLCLPYIIALPLFLSRLIYGRVRPTIYLAFLLKKLRLNV